jgi:Zn finger protein HypA/HybF involved in hydrogenase expression
MKVKVLCDRCKREFEIDDTKVLESELICPDCQDDADIELF